MSSNSSFDVLTATATSLQEQLSSGTITSVEIVESYLAQIEKHNHAGMKLNVLISVAPAKDAIARASVLDDERRQGKIRGPLHGLPIIVKDCIMTAPELGMDTTVGAYVFAGLKPKKNAAVIDQCIENGMIILGKATLTEFCGHRGTDVRPGYSAYGGQTLSAYDPREPGPPTSDKSSLIRNTACGGSSSGSAVGVSAGFSPLSLGTDTSGSVVFPAGKNGVYGIKPSKGLVGSSGCFRISSSYDGIGAMAKTPDDLALLVESILLPKSRERLPEDGYRSFMTKSWEGARIGIVDLNWGGTYMGKWGSDGIVGVVERIRQLGGCAVYPVTPPDPESCKYKSSGLYHIACYEFNTVIKTFCDEFENARVHSLSDIIKYNEDNAATAMPDPFPDQKPLIDSFNSALTDEESQIAYAQVKKIAGEDGLGKLMEEHNVNMLVSHSDSTLISFANAAGWPSATVPLGIYEKNGHPYGLFVVARENREDLLFEFMSAFEATFPKIPSPKM